MATKKKNTETTTPAGMSLADKLALLDRIAEDANTSAGRVVMGRDEGTSPYQVDRDAQFRL